VKKKQTKKKPPLLHLSLGLGVALVATGWYWSGVRDFYLATGQAGAALLGFGQ